MFLVTLFGALFQTALVEVAHEQITVEIANTPELRAQGLMYRETLGANQGMLFIYDHPQILSFWMKNTHIPLSIGFFDENKKLIQIEHMHPSSSESFPLRVYRSQKPAQYALEVPQYWFEEHKIRTGMEFTFWSES